MDRFSRDTRKLNSRAASPSRSEWAMSRVVGYAAVHALLQQFPGSLPESINGLDGRREGGLSFLLPDQGADQVSGNSHLAPLGHPFEQLIGDHHEGGPGNAARALVGRPDNQVETSTGQVQLLAGHAANGIHQHPLLTALGYLGNLGQVIEDTRGGLVVDQIHHIVGGGANQLLHSFQGQGEVSSRISPR